LEVVEKVLVLEEQELVSLKLEVVEKVLVLEEQELVNKLINKLKYLKLSS
jgi:hypothetical protein